MKPPAWELQDLDRAVDAAEFDSQPDRASEWLRTAVSPQEGRQFVWAPVAMIAGISLNFALTAEPSNLVAAGIAVIAAIGLMAGRRSTAGILIALVAVGFVLAKVKSDFVATPLLTMTTPDVLVTGKIMRVERAARSRFTIVLAANAIEGLPKERVPKRLRLSSFPKYGTPLPGTQVALQARLAPLPSPVMPGGFDYGRMLWFEGIGGTGRVVSDIRVLDRQVPFLARFDAAMSSLRAAMGARIRAVLEEPYASFAEALITGERSAIPKEMNQSLMASGLFHILSISGLHMWLVAGGVFWAVRGGLAIFPLLALRFPIKKWAAVAALGMGLFYMLLADSGVATQRSYVMIAVAFFAVLADRPAISARTLAIAALLIVIFTPEAALEASFQMSFLAVLGLVAANEAWTSHRARRNHDSPARSHWVWQGAGWLVKAAALGLATTLVAGTLSSIPAAYHFGRLAPYSLIANGLAIPVVSLIVMPSALLAAILMPLGLEQWPLLAMDSGLRAVLAISDWVAGFGSANVVTPRPPLLGALMLGSGAIWLCLAAGWARLAGPAVMIVGIGVGFASGPAPDILIEQSGRNVAIRNGDGLLVPASSKRGRFAVGKWLLADGDEATAAEAAKRSAWTCADNRCSATVHGRNIVYFARLEGKPLDCAKVDVVIADFPLRGACKMAALRVDRFDLWRHGAHALRFAGNNIEIKTSRGEQGQRAWVVRPEKRSTFYPPNLQESGVP